MSADNWAICPRCKADAEKAAAEKKLAAGEAYGKVTPEKYLAMLDEAICEPRLEETLREDYCLRVDEDGMFQVEYSCSCSRCRFDFTFKHKENVQI